MMRRDSMCHLFPSSWSPPGWLDPYLKLNQQPMNISQRQTGQVHKANLLFMTLRGEGERHTQRAPDEHRLLQTECAPVPELAEPRDWD